MISLLKPKSVWIFRLLGSLSLVLFLGQISVAQLIVEPDTTICNGGSATLTATVAAGGTGGINFNNLQTVSLGDDQYSAAINIGFNFDFYGNTYTQCVIASNNYISFDMSQAGQFSPWAINAAIPDPTLPLDAIMTPYQDINPGAGGVIEYGTVGTAPNRIFVVRYVAVPTFGCATMFYCAGLFLFEGTNIIETHIQDKPLCGTWNNGAAIHGLHNSNGTVADVVPGRNFPAQWAATADAWSFVPNGPNYTITNIPFVSILSNNNSVNWYSTPNGALVGTGASINVSPTVTTTYWAEVDGACGGNTLIDSATVTVVTGSLPIIVTGNNTCKNSNDAFIEITPTGPNNPWNYVLDQGGTSIANMTIAAGVDSFTNLSIGTYGITQVESNGCVSTMNVVLSEPDSVFMMVSNDTLMCIGGTNILSAVGSDGNGGPYTLVWDNGLVGNGPHSVSPLATTVYHVHALDALGCASEADSITVDLNPPLVGSVPVLESVCPGDRVTLFASAGGGSGNGYTYVWDDGTGNTMNGFIVDVFPTVTSTYCITITDDCETPPVQECITVVVHEMPVVSFSQDTTEGCTPVAISFTNNTAANLVEQALWDFGDGNSSDELSTAINTYVTPGCYDVTLTVTSASGCSTTETVISAACSHPYPVAEFDWNPRPTTIFDPEIDFTNLSQDNVLNQWYFGGLGSSTDLNPTFIFPDDVPGTYDVQLVVTNEFTCATSITHDIIIQDEMLFYAPNAFTPNADGINDYWYVVGGNIDADQFQLLIFNRWGNIVFKTTDIEDQWDGTYLGTAVPNDTYVWKVKTRTASLGEGYERMGHVTVVK